MKERDAIKNAVKTLILSSGNEDILRYFRFLSTSVLKNYFQLIFRAHSSLDKGFSWMDLLPGALWTESPKPHGLDLDGAGRFDGDAAGLK